MPDVTTRCSRCGKVTAAQVTTPGVRSFICTDCQPPTPTKTTENAGDRARKVANTAGRKKGKTPSPLERERA